MGLLKLSMHQSHLAGWLKNKQKTRLLGSHFRSIRKWVYFWTKKYMFWAPPWKAITWNVGAYPDLGRSFKNVRWPSQWSYVTNGAKINVLRQQRIVFHASVGKRAWARCFMLTVGHAAVVTSVCDCVHLMTGQGWMCKVAHLHWCQSELPYQLRTHLELLKAWWLSLGENNEE